MSQQVSSPSQSLNDATYLPNHGLSGHSNSSYPSHQQAMVSPQIKQVSNFNLTPTSSHVQATSQHSSALKAPPAYANGMTDDEYGQEPDEEAASDAHLPSSINHQQQMLSVQQPVFTDLDDDEDDGEDYGDEDNQDLQHQSAQDQVMDEEYESDESIHVDQRTLNQPMCAPKETSLNDMLFEEP